LNKMDMTAIILAGGKSSRMKSNKALLPVSGIKLIEKLTASLKAFFDEIIISTNSENDYSFLSYKQVIDEGPDQGPLMGILTGLKASNNLTNFVIACDIPEIDIFPLKIMSDQAKFFDLVVPISDNGRYEPLYAFYNKRLIPEIEHMLGKGIRKVTELYKKCQPKLFPMKTIKSYYNLNTKTDYFKYITKPANTNSLNLRK